jgi:hypothetical protein
MARLQLLLLLLLLLVVVVVVVLTVAVLGLLRMMGWQQMDQSHQQRCSR